MKYLPWKTALSLAVLLAGWAGPAMAQDGDNDGCSNATLHGDYAFTLHGESTGVVIPQPPGTPPKVAPFLTPLPADGVAMTHFNGSGGLTQVDVVMRNGTTATTATTPTTKDGFRDEETGTYYVAPDCTGWFKINFPDTTEIDVVFVLGRGGKEIRTVVTRQHVPQLPPAIIPPGVSCALASGGCDLGVQIRSDGVKLDIWSGIGPQGGQEEGALLPNRRRNTVGDGVAV